MQRISTIFNNFTIAFQSIVERNLVQIEYWPTFIKELNIFHSNFIFGHKPLIFQANSVIPNKIKGCKDIGIIKFVFVTNAQFFWLENLDFYEHTNT